MRDVAKLTDHLGKSIGKSPEEGLPINGRFVIEHVRDGQVIDEREVKNLVVTVGKGQVAGLINGATTGAFAYIAIGTGTGAPAAGDTILGTEITQSGGARATATCTRITSATANDTSQMQVTYSFTGTIAITESGVFNSTTAGSLLCRQTFAAINVVNGDSLQITWKVTVG